MIGEDHLPDLQIHIGKINMGKEYILVLQLGTLLCSAVVMDNVSKIPALPAGSWPLRSEKKVGCLPPPFPFSVKTLRHSRVGCLLVCPKVGRLGLLLLPSQSYSS